MKFLFGVVILSAVIYLFHGELSPHDFSSLQAPVKLDDPLFESKIPVENRFWCRDGFKIENLSRLAEINVVSAFEEVNTFMGRKGMYHKGNDTSRCKIIGVMDLVQPKMAETLGDGNVYLDVPKIIDFCRVGFTDAEYSACWKMVIEHELLHLVNVIHISRDAVGVMNPVPGSLHFTRNDRESCKASTICAAYLR